MISIRFPMSLSVPQNWELNEVVQLWWKQHCRNGSNKTGCMCVTKQLATIADLSHSTAFNLYHLWTSFSRILDRTWERCHKKRLLWWEGSRGTPHPSAFNGLGSAQVRANDPWIFFSFNLIVLDTTDMARLICALTKRRNDFSSR